jgi:cellulose biosynthesis protein BcsQ
LREGENQIAGKPKADDKMANDVARLYSWANVDDAPYRDFFRFKRPQRRPLVPNEPQADVPEASEPISAKECRSQTPVVEAPQSPPPRIVTDPVVSRSGPAADSTEGEVIGPRSGKPATMEPEIASTFAVLSGEPQIEHPARGMRLASEQSEFHPAMAIFSLAGGVGKTTLCANLGRALYSGGDRVLLVDASGCGLLPFYFGANDLQPGLHTFFDPESDRAPMHVISGDEITLDWLIDDVRAEMDSTYWTIFDLGAASTHLLPQILSMCAFVLIPLLPDMNSILSVSRIESMFEQMRLRGAGVPSPFYLFNKFDAEDEVDEGARELVLRQCGGRLLPWSIRYDAEAARAIARRKTVIDHAPDAELANASLKLAALLQRTVAGKRARRSGRRWTDA